MTDSGDWREHAARLAAYLSSEGLDDTWADVFARVPRHEFVTGGRTIDIDGVASEDASWDGDQLLREAYDDQVIVTRWKTIHGERVATSSASQPAIMATMLRLLDVSNDSRVLEIGTGPGYNACLLCTRLGDDKVTSVDIQADVVDEARERLERLGFHPHVEAADGSIGCPSRAPFDRVIATCGLARIPRPWLDQLAPDARVVAPMSFGGALAVLDRRDDGSLRGRFPADAGFFMELRHADDSTDGEPLGYLVAPPRVFTTDVDPDALGDLEFRLWLELAIPGVVVRVMRAAGGLVVNVRVAARDARVDVEVDGGARVSEYGKPLWPTIERLLTQWREHGRPERTRMGMTVTPKRQWVWLDDEDSEIGWEI